MNFNAVYVRLYSRSSGGHRVETDEAFHGALDDSANSAAHSRCGFGQHIAVVVGYRAYKVDAELLVALILANVAYKEGLERVEHQTMDGGFLNVLYQEGGHRCHEAVALRLLVDTTNNGHAIQIILLEEFFAQGLGQLVLEYITQQYFAQNGTRALITEDITQR